MDKIKIIFYYLIILMGLILEIVFLFEIPYYSYINFLKYLKISRILLGFLIFLIDFYFRVVSIAETLLNKRKEKIKKDKYFADKTLFYLIDKILIICGFTISLLGFVLNTIGVVLSSKKLKNNHSTEYQNKISRCSLILLFENILFIIAWIFFVIYWGFNVLNKIVYLNQEENNQNKDNKDKKSDEEKFNFNKNLEGMTNDIDAPPIFLGAEIASSGRRIKEKNNDNKENDNIIK